MGVNVWQGVNTWTVSGGLSINPVGISSEESFSTPLVIYDQLVTPPSLTSQEALGIPTLLTGGVTITPNPINSSEEFGLLSVVYAQLVLPTTIETEEDFGIAIFRDGSSVVIPVSDRVTYEKIASHLKSTGKFTQSQVNEVIMEWLRLENIDYLQFNDALFEYWKSQGYGGVYNDKWRAWVNDS